MDVKQSQSTLPTTIAPNIDDDAPVFGEQIDDTPPEKAALRALYAQHLQPFTADPAAAQAVAAAPNPALAALTIVCSTLLTTDAALTNR